MLFVVFVDVCVQFLCLTLQCFNYCLQSIQRTATDSGSVLSGLVGQDGEHSSDVSETMFSSSEEGSVGESSVPSSVWVAPDVAQLDFWKV